MNCNTPAQLPCGPGPYQSAICYTIPPSLTLLPGIKEVTLTPGCALATSTILDTNGAPVVGAVEAPCPGACSDCGQGAGGGGGGGVVFPLLAPNGSCAAPSYSFAASPSSGMWFDPALGVAGAVVISDNNCANRINVGASIEITSSAGNVTINSGNNVTINCGATTSVIAVENVTITSTTESINISSQTENVLISADELVRITSLTDDIFLFTGTAPNQGIISMQAGSSIAVASQASTVSLAAATSVAVSSGSVLRHTYTSTGEWDIGGSVGTAGQVITSNGLGVPPTWQAVSPSFPLLAPDGSCAAPSYSFTSSPDSGMFYTGTAVRISDDNCADFIEVGASITIQSTASSVSVQSAAASFIVLTGGGVFLNSGAGQPIGLQSGSSIGMTTSAGFTASITVGAGGAFSASANGSILSIGATGAISFATAGATIAVTAAGEFTVGANPGVAGQVLTSQGPGLPPVWA